ncbi:MAG TPA: hypothetical protein QF555_04300 [Candidatus Thalassarchaeaceae archaeon]|jgi:DNA primase large subunit|nr:hypothetical protein [Candidatus Thalassarchaeaceae archaeon]
MPMPLRPPPISDAKVLARYPFLPQAAEHTRGLLDENGISMDDLLSAAWLSDIRRKGDMRVKESVLHDDGIEQRSGDLSTELGRMSESLSFLYAMMVACATFDERVTARWAEGEASRADKLLGSDGVIFETIASTYLSKIQSEVMGGDTVYSIPLTDFIELCPRISGDYWRLPNRPLKDGWVEMGPSSSENSQQRLARLIKERIREDLRKRCDIRMEKIDEGFAERLSEPVGAILTILQSRATLDFDAGSATQSEWPPCMQAAIAELAMGENVNHSGRLFLAAISAALGIEQEQCASFFQGAPDFNPETTRYQIGHVYDREYTPAGCSRLKMDGRCPVSPGDDPICDRPKMKHPLSYVWWKQRDRPREEEQVDESEEEVTETANP